MIDAMAGGKILSGVRGRAPADITALTDIIVRFSWMVSDLRDQISEIDVNPLIVGTDGAIAVDALIVRT
jgi:acetyltransferase